MAIYYCIISNKETRKALAELKLGDFFNAFLEGEKIEGRNKENGN
jgi:hypothetical protein